MRLRELSFSPCEGDDVELGREERDRWVCCRTGYLTNVRPKPARVGYKRVSVTPSPEFSPHKAPISFPLFLSPFSPFFSSFLPRVDALLDVVALARSKVSGFMKRLLSACRNTLRALCSRIESRKAFDNWKTRSKRTDRLVSALNIKRCLKEILQIMDIFTPFLFETYFI